MTFARVLIVFLLGVGVTLGLYLAGIGQRVPEWWSSWDTSAPDALPPSTALTMQTTAPGGAVGTVEQGQSGAAPGTGYPVYPGSNGVAPGTEYPAYPGGPNGVPPAGGDPGYPGSNGMAPDEEYPGYPGGQNGAPPAAYPGGPGAPAIATADGGAPLRLTIVPSRQGFEASCTIYAVVNRSQRPVVLAHNGSGILVKPGETVADESMPEDCAGFRSLFAGHRVPVGGPVYGAPPTPVPPGEPTWGEPFVKIEITDCAFGECGAVQY